MAELDPVDFAEAQERVAEFYRDFPEGSIRTFAVKLDGPEAVFEARVYRTPEEASMGIYTSGWAREVEGKSPGRARYLESCESGAVARALANLGYTGGGGRRPGRSEAVKAA